MFNRSISQYQPPLDQPVTPSVSLPPVYGGEAPRQTVNALPIQPQASIDQAISQIVAPNLITPKLLPKSPIPSTPSGSFSKEVIKQPVNLSHVSLPQKIVDEIRENPLVDTKALHDAAPQISWKTTVIIGVVLFFLGAFLAMVAMFSLV